MQVVSYLGAARPAFSRSGAAGTWCTNPRKALFFRSLCTKSRGHFRPAAATGLGAKIPARPCSSVPFAPSLGPVLARGRRGLGARIPANPCSSVPFAPSLGPVLVRGRRGLGARIPAKPCYFVPFAPSLGPRRLCPRPRPARRALFAVMLFINLQKRYNEVARLARGRFGRRKGTRSKQFITGG